MKDKLKIALIVITIMAVGLACFSFGQNTAVKEAKTNNKAYQVYIYSNGSATVAVSDVELITEGHSGLFISNGR